MNCDGYTVHKIWYKSDIWRMAKQVLEMANIAVKQLLLEIDDINKCSHKKKC